MNSGQSYDEDMEEEEKEDEEHKERRGKGKQLRFKDEEARQWVNSSSSSAPSLSTRRKAVSGTSSSSGGISQLRYSAAAGAVKRSITIGPFEDTENTFWPSGCEIYVYQDGEVMVNSRYSDIPPERSVAFLDGVSTKAHIDTIVLTGSREIVSFTPPTRLDHMSVEEIARTVSDGDIGVLATASSTSSHLGTLALPHFSNSDDDDDDHDADADDDGGDESKSLRTSPEIESNPDIIWGKVMPNSMPSGTTLRTKKGSVVHISDTPRNTFVFPNAHVDHRIQLVLEGGEGDVRLSYFTRGLEFSPEAVVELTKSRSSKNLTYGGNLSLLLRTQNSTATEFHNAKLRLSMARVGPRMMRRGMEMESVAKYSMAASSSRESRLSPQVLTAVGPIDVFEYRGVRVPMGTNYVRVMKTSVKVAWSLRYDIGDMYSQQPSIYGGIKAEEMNVPPSTATFILNNMRVGWTRIRQALAKGKPRFFHLGEDTMVEIQNNTSSSRTEIRRVETIYTTSQIIIINRKNTNIDLTLYRNLTTEEQFVKTEFIVKKEFKLARAASDAEPPGATVVPVEKILQESPEFATKQTNTAKVVVIELKNIPRHGGTVRVTTVVSRPYHKSRKSMHKLYLVKEKGGNSLASDNSDAKHSRRE